MNAPREAALRVVRTLVEHGHVAYFAGGCVRDELLGGVPEDYDVATSATPDEVDSLFRNAKSVGKSFGVMLVRDKKIVTEVATFREESGYSDKRRPDEVRFADARADAKRRDFTINAMFLDPLAVGDRAQGRVIDLVGGLVDLDAKIVRAVGDPEARLAEDHLRALRAVRFAARLGFKLEERTARAISAHAAELEGVSRERVGDEVRRILADRHRHAGGVLIHKLALDGPVLHDGHAPEAALSVLASLPGGASAMLGLAGWTVDRLIARGHVVEEGNAERAVHRLRRALVLANDECEVLRGVLGGVRIFERSWAGATVAQQKRWAAASWSEGALAIIGARDPDLRDAIEAEIGVLAQTGGGLAPVPLVTGDHLVEAGFTPGPLFGVWLDSVYDAQLEGRISSREQGIELIGKMVEEPEPRE